MKNIIVTISLIMLCAGLTACAKPDKKHVEARYTSEAIAARKAAIEQNTEMTEGFVTYEFVGMKNQ